MQDTVKEILHNSDLNSITLRQVMQQVEDKLGSPSKPFKAVVKVRTTTACNLDGHHHTAHGGRLPQHG